MLAYPTLPFRTLSCKLLEDPNDQKHMINKLPIWLTAFLILSCSSPKKGDSSIEKPGDNKGISNVDSKKEDNVEVPPFEIELSVSKKAEKRLLQEQKKIIVTAHFSGKAKDNVKSNATDFGLIDLGSHSVKLTEGSVAKFEKLTIPRATYEGLADKNYEVLINIYSSRKEGELNFLNGEILQRKINDVKNKRHKLGVKLLKQLNEQGGAWLVWRSLNLN